MSDVSKRWTVSSETQGLLCVCCHLFSASLLLQIFTLTSAFLARKSHKGGDFLQRHQSEPVKYMIRKYICHRRHQSVELQLEGLSDVVDWKLNIFRFRQLRNCWLDKKKVQSLFRTHFKSATGQSECLFFRVSAGVLRNLMWIWSSKAWRRQISV